MIDWPARPFNPFSLPTDAGLTVPEVLAGPGGLLLFPSLIPLIWLIARWNRPAGILIPAALWLGLTGGVIATTVLAAWTAVGIGIVVGLGRWRRGGGISVAGAETVLWVALGGLFLPLWWQADWGWYGWIDLATAPPGWIDFRTSPLHFFGFAYALLRLIAWGRTRIRNPEPRIDWPATLCWLAYPPTQRFGPVIEQATFAEQFAAWRPAAPTAWRAVLRRTGWLVLGGVCAGVLNHNLAIVDRTGAFFTRPEALPTEALLALLYGIPTAAYLFLWLYNELAAVCGHLVGLPVPDNFRWAPLATDIGDFWRRWHVTVADWLRVNIFFPVATSLRIAPLAALAAFGFAGLWHGAAWSFVVWAVLQATAVSVQRWWSHRRRGREEPGAVWRIASWLVTLHFVIVTAIVFLDVDHGGLRVLGELIRRVTGG